MKNFTNEENKVIEMFVVAALVIAMYLVGIVMPVFGDFLACTPVSIVVLGGYLGYVIYGFIEIYEMRTKESLHNKKEL